MLRYYHKTKNTSCPWPKDKIPDYDNRDYFNFSKEENFDYDKYIYVAKSINNCNLSAEITKNKGEKVTEIDLNNAFAISLFGAMTGFDFNSETALNYFTILPPEFYTKESFAIVCEKMKNFEYLSSKFEQDRLEKNLRFFHEFAHKVNPEEIPAPIARTNGDRLSRTK